MKFVILAFSIFVAANAFARAVEVEGLDQDTLKVIGVVVQNRETGKSEMIQIADGVKCRRLAGKELLPYQCPTTGERYADWDLCDKECK